MSIAFGEAVLNAYVAGKRQRMLEEQQKINREQWEQEQKNEQIKFKEQKRQFEEKHKLDVQQALDRAKAEQALMKYHLGEQKRANVKEMNETGSIPKFTIPNLGSPIQVPEGGGYTPQYSQNALYMQQNPELQLSQVRDTVNPDIVYTPEDFPSIEEQAKRAETMAWAKQAPNVWYRNNVLEDQDAKRMQQWDMLMASIKSREGIASNNLSLGLMKLAKSGEDRIKAAEAARAVTGIVTRLYTGEDYKAFRDRNDSYQFVKRLMDNINNPDFNIKTISPDGSISTFNFKTNPGMYDRALLYAYGRANDPNRVSDDEMKKGAEEGISKLEAAGIAIRRLMTPTGRLTPSARQSILNIVQMRRDASWNALKPKVDSAKNLAIGEWGLSEEKWKNYWRELGEEDPDTRYQNAEGGTTRSLPPPPKGYK